VPKADRSSVCYLINNHRSEIPPCKEVTKEIIENTSEEPLIRAELFDAGVLMRLRYKVEPPRRQEVSTSIVNIIFREFNKNPKVEFCYPRSEITYEWKGRLLPPHPAMYSVSDGDKEED